YPAGLDGGRPTVGSGKSVTPWARMHSEVASICALKCAVAAPLGAGGPPPGNFFMQVARAASNAGDAGLRFAGRLTPPPPLGSGKSGTPCERMQTANAKALPPAPP